MKFGNFVMKLVSFAVIFALLWQYQGKAETKARLEEENEEQIAEIKAYNKEIERQIYEIENAPMYIDGVYEGTGLGFGGDVTVAVTIENDEYTKIEVIRAMDEDAAYLEQAVTILDKIVKYQDADVDAVAGATMTAEGLIEATQNAIAQAVNK